MAILDDVRQALRIKHVALDNEIIDLINEAKADLALSGVDPTKINDDDPLIKRAIKTYAKANFGLENKDSEKYQASYDSLKTHLTLSGDYNV